ncbi:MAG: hypothetical protein C0418_04570 [Coriobacteriaceae bacterium]|nr:hypothetical protein [Coriobacteriaceae bacterium]
MTVHTMDESKRIKYLMLVVLVGIAFFGSYGFAAAKARAVRAAGGTALQAGFPAAAGGAGAAAGGGCGMGCCGGGGNPTGQPIEKATTVSGDVQTIEVDASQGYYDPDTIRAKAGVPLRITFSQASGCLGQVVFPQFNKGADLSAGPQTIELPALEPGEYQFSCGMGMVFGKLIVEREA